MIHLGIPNAGTSFVYHPLYLFVLSPLIEHMDLDQFTCALVAINAISVGLLASESLRLAGGGDSRREKVALALVCVSFPAMYSAFLGQNILPTAVLILLAWRSLSNSGWLLGAILLTFAVAMKFWVLPLAISMLFLRGFRVTLYGVAALTIGLLILPWLVNSQLLFSYLDIAHRLSQITVYPYNNVSVRGFLQRLAAPNWVEDAYTWGAVDVFLRIRLMEALFQVLIGIAVILAYVKRRPEPTRTFVSLLCLILLLPGVCWTHYFVLAIPLAVFLWLRAPGYHAIIGLIALLIMAVPWHSYSRGIVSPLPLKQLIIDHSIAAELLLALPPAMVLTLVYAALFANFVIPDQHSVASTP